MSAKRLFLIITSAVLIKLFLFAFFVCYVPQGKFLNDTPDYINAAEILSSQGTFALAGADGVLNYDLHRAPGYAFFLFILHGCLHLSFDTVIFIQILLTLLAAGIIYKAAVWIDPKIAFLSAVIVLFDPPVSIFSLIILSEVLFFFLLACFMLIFVKFLKEKRTYQVVISALALVLATYVRPTSYYLGIALAIFILYAGIRAGGFKKAILHASVFLVLVYSLLGIWESRNYRLTGVKTFASVIQTNPKKFGLWESFSNQVKYAPNKIEPAFCYLKSSLRCFLSLMTRPGPFKYFRSAILSAIGKVLAYPWMVFWVLGLIIGVAKTGSNIYYQFILLVIAYFIVTSIEGAGFLVGERFRVPMVPFIAVLSAYGWSVLNTKNAK